MKTRKLLAIVLAVAMLASFVSIPVFADGHEGEMLETLGILVGTGEGVTEEYLASTATRAQAALIHLRLFALEVEAHAFEGTETFTDAAEATEYWQPILEYLKANEELGWQGYPDGSFDPNGTITGQEFTKVILVALGYEEEVDFTWETSTAFAASLGIEALVDKVDEVLTVADIAAALVEALGTKTTAAIDVTLLTWLVMQGVIDEADAIAAGFVIEDPALVIVSAGPTAVDEITVEMSTDVPEDTDVTLKRGSVGLAYDLDIDGSTVVLTGLYKFLPGTYTVTVGDEAASFVIESQTATDLVIEADTIYDSGEQDLKVKLADQYGDSMSLAGANISVFNQTTGYVFTPDKTDNTVKITIEDISTTSTVVMNAKAGDVVYVFVYDPASGLTATKEVLVMEAPYIAWLEIGDVTIGKIGDTVQSRLYVGTVGNKLDVTAYDQYNQVYTLTTADIGTGTANKVQILSSNEGVISSTMTVDKGDLVFSADATGSAVITLIIPNQGFIASSEPITVYAMPTLTTVEIAGPATAVYADETAKFPIVGYDQYNQPIDVAAGATNVTFSTTVNLGPVPTIGAKNEVHYAPTDDGTTTVYYFANGIFQDTFTVVVNPEAYPFQITGTDLPGALQTGVSVELLSEDITVIDQYGRTMKTPFDGTYDGSYYNFVATAKTGETHVELLSNGGYTLTTAGLTAGSDQFTLVLTKDGTPQTESTFVLEMVNIAATDIDGFEMAALTTMYTGTEVDTYGQAAGAYNKTVKITGTADGMSVVLLDADDDGLPDVIDVVTSSNAAVEVVSGSTLTRASVSDTSTTIRAWRNGAAVAMTELDLAKVAPDLASITPVKAGTWHGTYATSFKFVDQYGVTLDAATVIAANSPYGADGDYTIETTYTVGTETWFTVVKWDGSLSSTIKVKTTDLS